MIEIAQFSRDHQEGVVSVILPVQQEEFGIPVTLADQPDLLDIPNFYEKNGFKEITKPQLPPAFPIMAVDTKFYRHQLPNADVSSL